jgi:hypothetical protein
VPEFRDLMFLAVDYGKEDIVRRLANLGADLDRREKVSDAHLLKLMITQSYFLYKRGSKPTVQASRMQCTPQHGTDICNNHFLAYKVFYMSTVTYTYGIHRGVRNTV